jgi:hypothetical protein
VVEVGGLAHAADADETEADLAHAYVLLIGMIAVPFGCSWLALPLFWHIVLSWSAS